MRSYLNPFILIFTIGIFLSCDKNDNPITLDKDNDFYYPLKVGNQWEYNRTFTIFNFRPDTLSWDAFDDTTTSFLTMKIIRTETIHDSINTFVFRETILENGTTIIDDSYYANLDSGLYFYAYHGGGLALPKVSQAEKIFFKGRYFNNVREITSYITDKTSKNDVLVDSLIYEIPPLLSLEYPIKIGSQWTYRYPGHPWHIDKKILTRETVKLSVGSFNCYKIQRLYDIDDDGKWDEDIIFNDYICDKGLLMRSILYKDCFLTGTESPEPLGIYDCQDEYVLTKLTLQ